MRISDWSSDVCSSDLRLDAALGRLVGAVLAEIVVGIELVAQLAHAQLDHDRVVEEAEHLDLVGDHVLGVDEVEQRRHHPLAVLVLHVPALVADHGDHVRSEEHTSELQSLMRISYAVFCFKKKKKAIKRTIISIL